MNFAMTIEVNQGVVGDTAKLIMHRLIARQLCRDPALVEKAKIAHAQFVPLLLCEGVDFGDYNMRIRIRRAARRIAERGLAGHPTQRRP